MNSHCSERAWIESEMNSSYIDAFVESPSADGKVTVSDFTGNRTLITSPLRARAVLAQIAIVVTLGALIFACGPSRESAAPQGAGTIRGIVYVVGNEPFTYLALQDSSGSMHRLRGPKELENVLYQRQGKMAVVTIVSTEQEPEGPITVISKATFPTHQTGGPADSTGR